MSNAFIYNMPAGIAGDVTRKEHSKIESHIMDANYPVTKYGIPVKMVSGKIRPMAASDSGQPYGFSVRPYPALSSASEALGTATPATDQPIDVLVSGYIIVDNKEGTPAKGGAVYYRSQELVDATKIGQIEAASDASPETNVAITNALFMGSADSDGNVEIKFNV